MKKDSRYSESIKEMRNLVIQKDWSQTSIGPREEWPKSLKTLVEMLLEHPFPCILLWGPELIQIYNDGYREIAGDKHPEAFGQPTRECWPEVWQINQPIYEKVLNRGQSVVLEDQLFPIHRHEYDEDAYFTLSYSPARNDEREIAGVFLTIFETTERRKAKQKLEEQAELDAFCVKLADAIRPLEDPVEIQREAAHAIGEYLGVDRANYGEVFADGNTNILHTDYFRGDVDSIAGKYKLDDFGVYIRENLQAGNTVVIDDFSTFDGLNDREKKIYEETNINAWVGVPLIKKNRLRAYFVVSQSEGRKWTDLEVQMIEETVERTWASVERALVEQAMRESEARLDAFVTATSEVVYRMSPDWSEMYYLDGQEFIPDTKEPRETWLGEYIPPHEQERVQAAISEAIRTKSTFQLEHQVLQVDGSPGWTNSRAIPILDKEGEIMEWFGTATDITERKGREQELRESEARLQMAQNTAQLGSWEMDVEAETFSASLICKAQFGRAPKDPLTYNDIIESIHPEDLGAKKKIMKEALETGTGYEIEYRIMRPDGALRWIYTRARPLGDSKLTGVTLDITDPKEIEEELEQQTKELKIYQEKLRSLVDELGSAEENVRRRLAGELHDNLGQILAVCKMKIDGILKKEENLPELFDDVAELVHNAITYTRRLMNDLKPNIIGNDEDLIASLKWVAQKLDKHGLNVDIKDDKVSKIVAEKDRVTIVQAVRELLYNVLKHAETDRATILVSTVDGYLKIVVFDEGKGFKPDKQKRSSVNESNGFGLFNIQERIDMLGGRFTIDSKPEVGTKATLYIPLHENGEKVEEKFKVSASQKEYVSSDHSVINVMIVEDHQMVRDGITAIINAENDMHVVSELDNGEQAINEVDVQEPDVIIMDINLPGISGIEATREILTSHPAIKVIGLSFHNDADVINNMLDAGASGFISKDEALEIICDAIRGATC